MIAPVLLVISVAVVFVVERWIKRWGLRLLLTLTILGTLSICVFNAGLSAGDSAARTTLSREVAEELQEFQSGGGTNRAAEVNFLEERLLKIIAAR